MEVINTIGRRKTAVARIYMKKGSGNITINNRDYKEYFNLATQIGRASCRERV